MKQCIALAGLLCLLASGCAQSGMMGVGCGDACHVTTHRRAPRPLLTRDACKPSARVFGGEEYCEEGGCPIGGGFGACPCDGCAAGGPCQRLAERIAQGFCNGSCGIGPHAGGYPESPAFQPGPPTGQVAYPYYTTRGPRDFLLDNPPHIGPY